MTDEELELLRLLNKGEIKEMVDVPVSSMTASTAAIDPNIFYVWDEMTSLTITLNTPEDTSIMNEYMFQFKSGDTATTLSLPTSLSWIGTYTVESGKTYNVSIVNDIAVMGGAS